MRASASITMSSPRQLDPPGEYSQAPESTDSYHSDGPQEHEMDLVAPMPETQDIDSQESQIVVEPQTSKPTGGFLSMPPTLALSNIKNDMSEIFEFGLAGKPPPISRAGGRKTLPIIDHASDVLGGIPVETRHTTHSSTTSNTDHAVDIQIKAISPPSHPGEARSPGLGSGRIVGGVSYSSHQIDHRNEVIAEELRQSIEMDVDAAMEMLEMQDHGITAFAEDTIDASAYIETAPLQEQALARQPFSDTEDSRPRMPPLQRSRPVVVEQTAAGNPQSQKKADHVKRSQASTLKVRLAQPGEKGCALIPSSTGQPHHPADGDLPLVPHKSHSAKSGNSAPRTKEHQRQYRKQAPAISGTPIQRSDSRVSNMSRRRAELPNQQNGSSSPLTLSERNNRFGRFATTFNDLSVYDKKLLETQESTIISLNSKLAEYKAHFREIRKSFETQQHAAHKLQKENVELVESMAKVKQSSAKTGERLAQAKEKYQALKKHANDVLKEQQDFREHTNLVVQKATTGMTQDMEVQRLKHDAELEEARRAQTDFREKVTGTLKEAREHCRERKSISGAL